MSKKKSLWYNHLSALPPFNIKKELVQSGGGRRAMAVWTTARNGTQGAILTDRALCGVTGRLRHFPRPE